MSTACVITPLYKELPDHNDKISLAKLREVLMPSYDCYFVVPKQLNLDPYHNFIQGSQVIRFNDRYFRGIDGYNELMLSESFYQKFTNYEFGLLYQTDAYVFRDELILWCDKQFDYIGAPWFEGWGRATNDSKVIGAGNGGFSLRNIKKSITVLKRYKRLQLLQRIWSKLSFERVVKLSSILGLFRSPLQLKHDAKLGEALLLRNINEDFFWAGIAGEFFKDYVVCEASEAIKFSFEVNPSRLYEMNNYELPFGCHGWNKYSPDFWNRFIGSGKQSIEPATNANN